MPATGGLLGLWMGIGMAASAADLPPCDPSGYKGPYAEEASTIRLDPGASPGRLSGPAPLVPADLPPTPEIETGWSGASAEVRLPDRFTFDVLFNPLIGRPVPPGVFGEGALASVGVDLGPRDCVVRPVPRPDRVP